MMQSIADTLNEREKTYGDFLTKANTIQELKRVMRAAPGWHSLPNDMKESLEMQATKIGRILHGNPAHHDSWHDIGGYSKLVADRLAKNE